MTCISKLLYALLWVLHWFSNLLNMFWQSPAVSTYFKQLLGPLQPHLVAK